ncbi:MAG: hypothetical protein HN608_02115, partial [Rhodospirillaceae bacterium]|nr:hypothetical protein [Rhodospirillaceae bacterium]
MLEADVLKFTPETMTTAQRQQFFADGFLVLEDVLLMIWGTDPYFAYQPMSLLGSVDIAEMTFATYNLTLIALAAVVGLGLWLGLTKTKWGKLLLAVIFDREVSQAMGI